MRRPWLRTAVTAVLVVGAACSTGSKPSLDEARRVFEAENARISAGDAVVRSFRQEGSDSLDFGDASAYQLTYSAEVECIRDANQGFPSDQVPCRSGLKITDRGSIFFVKSEEGWRGSLRDHTESVMP